MNREAFSSEYELEKRLLEKYKFSKEYAQKYQWKEHLSYTGEILPIAVFVNNNVMTSRLLGRMAWSHIRLTEFNRADILLSESEEYDPWQAAANYFWAAEYCHRQIVGAARHAGEYLDKFKKVYRQTDKTAPQEGSDLDLAICFYERFILVEAETGYTLLSDEGRYHELLARRDQNSEEYLRASDFYIKSNLPHYAACCVFYSDLISATNGTPQEKIKKLEKAKKVLDDNDFPGDEHVRKILSLYITTRIEIGNIIFELCSEKVDYRKIEKILSEIKKNSSTEGDTLLTLGKKIVILSNKTEWKELINRLENIGNVDGGDLDEISNLERKLIEIQKILPSYSFMIS